MRHAEVATRAPTLRRRSIDLEQRMRQGPNRYILSSDAVIHQCEEIEIEEGVGGESLQICYRKQRRPVKVSAVPESKSNTCSSLFEKLSPTATSTDKSFAFQRHP
uniref:(northern house mosquito) hypothetical protein n=1 Tax=Culex pipiens TaxID=7175 RepID=A0A8D8FE35_CULPI